MPQTGRASRINGLLLAGIIVPVLLLIAWVCWKDPTELWFGPAERYKWLLLVIFAPFLVAILFGLFYRPKARTGPRDPNREKRLRCWVIAGILLPFVLLIALMLVAGPAELGVGAGQYIWLAGGSVIYLLVVSTVAAFYWKHRPRGENGPNPAETKALDSSKSDPSTREGGNP